MNNSSSHQLWFDIQDGNVKILQTACKKYGIEGSDCIHCKYLIISVPYQQKICGNRYCKDCYEKLSDMYCCNACKIDDLDNFIHSKSDIYSDRAALKSLNKKFINCPDCVISIRLSELEDHILNCPNGWNQCEKCYKIIKKSSTPCQCEVQICNKCGKEVSDMKNHKEKCVINWKQFHCPYNCPGHYEHIQDHRLHKFYHHLDKAWAIMTSHGLTKLNGESTLDFEELRKRIINYIKKSYDLNVNDIDNLTNTMKMLSSSTEEDLSIYNSVKSYWNSRVSDSMCTSYDGTILWKIANFNEVKADAKSEKKKSIFSPPFFTSRFGYKMCLRLYPNGDSTAWDVAMSLFLVLMKGNYDAYLTWPFKQKVTFILLDQDFKTNMIDAFVPSDNLDSFSRPRTDMNIPSGSSYFIKFDDLKLRKYEKSNTIFVKCIIDCSNLGQFQSSINST